MRSRGVAGIALTLTVAVFLPLGGALLARSSAAADGVGSAGELQIKSAFLATFPKFVEWPARGFVAPKDAFIVGVVGDDPLAGAVADDFRRGRFQDRSIVVSRFTHAESFEKCHMLYISDSEEPRLEALLKRLDTEPVLTVASFSRFVERGGMIQLLTQAGKVKFRVNNRAARSVGLALSSRLLTLATTVAE